MSETPAETIRRAAALIRQRTAEAGKDGFAIHPGIALTLGDWLDREAALIDAQVFPQSDPVMEKYPLAVAHAYLGEPS